MGKAGITFGAFILIDFYRVQNQAIIFLYLVSYHKSVFRAILGNAKSAF